MIEIPQEEKKDYYSTRELAEASWFPIRNAGTVREKIEEGDLGAENKSPIEGQKKWKVPQKIAEEYIEQYTNEQ